MELRISRIHFFTIYILFLNGFARSLTITIIPLFFLGKFHIWQNSNFLLGMAIACHPIGSIATSYLIGKMSDYKGRHYSLILSICSVITGYILVILGITSQQISFFYMGLILSGISDSTIVISKSLICDISLETKKMFNLSRLELGSGGGWLLGPILGSTIYFYTNSFTSIKGVPFVIILILYSISLLVLLILLKKFKLGASTKLKDNNPIKYRPSLIYTMIMWSSYVLACDIFIHLISTFLIQKHQFYSISAGRMFSYMGLLYLIITTLIVMPTVKKLNKTILIARSAYLLQCLSIILFLCATNIIMLYIAISIFVLGQAFSVPASIAVISAQVSNNNHGTILGLACTLQALGVIIVGLLITPTITLSINIPFILSSCLLFISFILSFYISKD